MQPNPGVKAVQSEELSGPKSDPRKSPREYRVTTFSLFLFLTRQRACTEVRYVKDDELRKALELILETRLGDITSLRVAPQPCMRSGLRERDGSGDVSDPDAHAKWSLGGIEYWSIP